MSSQAHHILKNRNYRLYFLGQLVSLSGTWMQSVAQQWLVYRITHSGYWLGVITFSLQLPAFLASPLAGVLADQVNRRKVLIFTELIAGLQACVLAALVFSGRIDLWHIIALSIVLGVINAFEMTTRTAFVIDMVGKQELSKAITLNAVMFNTSRVLGPAFAGFLLGFVGEGWCFFLNGLSYLAVTVGLLAMRLPPPAPRQATGGLGANIVDGLIYVRRSPVLFRLLILATLLCFIAWPFMILLPIFAKQVLLGDAKTLGWLTALMGAGAVLGAFFFIRQEETAKLKRRLTRNVVGCGLSMVAFGLSKNLALSLIASFGVGCFMMTLFPTITNAVQHMVEDSKRGRVASLFSMSFLGTTPFGGLIVGWLSDRYTAPAVVIGCGVTTLALGFALVGRHTLRTRSARKAAIKAAAHSVS
jgi:MFS family permease